MTSPPIDMRTENVSAIVGLVCTAPVGTWFTYYEGVSPTAEQAFGDRHAQVAAIIRVYVERGLVTGALQRLESGDEKRKGRYRYMAKVIARQKA